MKSVIRKVMSIVVGRVVTVKDMYEIPLKATVTDPLLTVWVV